MSQKLLVVDDQDGMALVVARIGRTLGFEVRTITNPLNAVEAFLEYQPDVLFLDMIMPEKDGIDVLNEILLIGTHARIVLTSGFGDSYLRLAAGVARFHDKDQVTVIKKPFRREELAAALLLDRAPIREGSGA